MQGLSRWKGLVTAKSEKSESQSRSKSKKYTPTRNQTLSELNHKLKVINTSKMNQSSQLENSIIKQSNTLKISSMKGGQNVNQIKSPLRSTQSIKLDVKSQMKSIEDQIASPTICVKQMNRIRKPEQQDAIKVSKVLFSLDEQHRYIHKQLTKIKIQFAKLKQIVMGQLLKQKKQVEEISRKIYSRLEEVLQICSKNAQQVNTSGFNSPDNMKGINIQGFVFNNQNGKESFIPQISIIRQKSDLTESKLELKRMFGDENQKLQQILLSNKGNQSPVRRRYKNVQTDRIFTQKDEYRNSPIDIKKQINQLKDEVRNNRLQKAKVLKSKSKKEFDKLFEAVNSLKNEIKSFKGAANLSSPMINSFNGMKDQNPGSFQQLKIEEIQHKTRS